MFHALHAALRRFCFSSSVLPDLINSPANSHIISDTFCFDAEIPVLCRPCILLFRFTSTPVLKVPSTRAQSAIRNSICFEPKRQGLKGWLRLCLASQLQPLLSLSPIRTSATQSASTKPGTSPEKLRSGEQNCCKQKLRQSGIIPSKWPKFHSQNSYNLTTTQKANIYQFLKISGHINYYS